VEVYPWLAEERLVIKPDQLIGRRGKHRLLLLNASFEEAKSFLKENLGRRVTVQGTTGTLTHFLIEPFVQHSSEYYTAFRTERDADVLYFSTQGGVDVEEHWESVKALRIPVLDSIEDMDLTSSFSSFASDEKVLLSKFAKALYRLFRDLGFTFLELNPFTIRGRYVIPLDCRAKLDDASTFENWSKWGEIDFPTPFGAESRPEEKFVESLDEGTGASLKLKVLNPQGRIWTMVAGGGASVIYTDTICDLGYEKELANYGEYSGNPSEEETYQYAKTILDLMTRENGKGLKDRILLVGGGIANFTDVAETFKGLVRALKEHGERLRASNIRIYVRRGGPNYERGLEMMRELGSTLGIPIEVYGPETHMTRIVPMAILGTTGGG